MARYIPPHPRKGTPEARAWAERMRKARLAKRIRRAGQRTEQQFFGPGGPLTTRQQHNPSRSDTATMRRHGWKLTVGTPDNPKVFSFFGHGYLQVIQREARGWRLLSANRRMGQEELLSIGVYPLVLDAALKARNMIEFHNPDSQATQFRVSAPNGRWKYFDRLEDAKQHAARIQQRTGVIASIEPVKKPLRRSSQVVAQKNSRKRAAWFYHAASYAYILRLGNATYTIRPTGNGFNLSSVIGSEVVYMRHYPEIEDAMDAVDVGHGQRFTRPKTVYGSTRLNPGAAWHHEAADVAAYRGKQQPEPIAKALYKGMEVAHRDSARAAARLHMNPPDVPDIESPIYQERVRLPKYNVAVSPISAHGSDGVKLLIRRLPGWTKDHHQSAAGHHTMLASQAYQTYQRLVSTAEQHLRAQGQEPGPLIAGIVSNRFPEEVKDQLRTLARLKTLHSTAAWLHDHAAHSRMVPGIRTRNNPIAVYNPASDNPPKVSGVIYKKAIEIRAQKTDRLAGHYKHTFGPKVQILGLDNGDVLLHHTEGKPLWITKKDYDRQNRRH